MFVDTSAIVAILIGEDSAPELASALTGTPLAITSPVVVLEASMVMASKWSMPPEEAEIHVRTLLDGARVAVTGIDDASASHAIAAFSRYGKGRGNKARLNIADCLSYACAKQHRMPLLYVGDDFAQTDLA